MNARTLAVCSSIVSGLICTEAYAQTQWGTTQGMMTGASIGVVINTPGTPTSLETSTVGLRSPGIVTDPPAEWSPLRFGPATSGHPDYSTAALLEGINDLVHGEEADWVEFGGISTGGDVCPPISSLGWTQITQSFYFLSVTVAPKVSLVYGEPNSVLRNLDHPERAIISYYAEGSTGIDSTLVDRTVAEQTTQQLGYDDPSDDQVTGLDWGMGSISVDPNGNRSLLFAPVRDCFFFCLSQRWLTAFPEYVDENWEPLNAQTIYVMRWENLEWSAPVIAFTPEELFGEDLYEGKELDAISVFAPPANPLVRRVVFSATLASGLADQLHVFDASWTTLGGLPLRDNSGTLFSQNLGLVVSGDRDDVKGTCGTDPDPHALDMVIGIPMDRYDAGEAYPLGLTMYRSITGPSTAQVDTVNVQVTGIESTTGLPCDVVFHIGQLSTQQISMGNCHPVSWSPFTSVPVTPGSSTVSIEVPGNLGNLGPVALTATYHKNGSATPSRSSWITVLKY